MPKVREVFERAYGAIPDGATCHVGWRRLDWDSGVEPILGIDHEGSKVIMVWMGDGEWGRFKSSYVPLKGDISDQPAEAFSPVFQCAAYDAALDALKKVQPDPRTVIALADAMAVAEQQAEEPGSCHADDVRAYNARERYMEASREFWAALSADGTGESPVLSTHLDVMGGGK